MVPRAHNEHPGVSLRAQNVHFTLVFLFSGHQIWPGVLWDIIVFPLSESILCALGSKERPRKSSESDHIATKKNFANPNPPYAPTYLRTGDPGLLWLTALWECATEGLQGPELPHTTWIGLVNQIPEPSLARTCHNSLLVPITKIKRQSTGWSWRQTPTHTTQTSQ